MQTTSTAHRGREPPRVCLRRSNSQTGPWNSDEDIPPAPGSVHACVRRCPRPRSGPGLGEGRQQADLAAAVVRVHRPASNGTPTASSVS